MLTLETCESAGEYLNGVRELYRSMPYASHTNWTTSIYQHEPRWIIMGWLNDENGIIRYYYSYTADAMAVMEKVQQLIDAYPGLENVQIAYEEKGWTCSMYPEDDRLCPFSCDTLEQAVETVGYFYSGHIFECR